MDRGAAWPGHGTPHVVAARTVSLACFYLTLPAFYLLLGRLAVPPPRRLLVLALVLACPVYVYYSRAFLMDSMALLGSVWFLLGFVRTMDGRSWRWLALTIVAGTLAALVKSFIFVVWLIPAAGYGAWLLGARRAGPYRLGGGRRKPRRGGVATVAVALVCSSGGLPIRIASRRRMPRPGFFRRRRSPWATGACSISGRFSPPGSGASGWAAGTRRSCRGGCSAPACWPDSRCLPCAGACWRQPRSFSSSSFCSPSPTRTRTTITIPARSTPWRPLGFTLLGFLDLRPAALGRRAAFLVPFAGELNAYWRGYHRQQAPGFSGDLPFTAVLRELTPKNSVIVVAGADWAAMTPYYAQRKALMVRNGLEFDQKYLRRAFKDLDDEEVSALVLSGALRTNGEFIRMAAAQFNLDARAPTFSSAAVDVYIARPYARAVRTGLQDTARYTELTVPPAPPDETEKTRRAGVPGTGAHGLRERFPGAVSDAVPYQRRPGRGRDAGASQRRSLARAAGRGHPDHLGFWHHARRLRESPGSDRRRGVWHRGRVAPRADPPHLPPRAGSRAESRGPGRRARSHCLSPAAGEVLRFSTRPDGGDAFDWSYWAEIAVR